MKSPFRVSFYLVICFLFSLPCFAGISDKAPGGPVDGAGIWINIWNYPDSSNAEQYCQGLHNHGIRNCYVQTSRSNTDAIAHPTELSSLIDACHKHGIKVVAWSFTQLSNPMADAQRLLAAARFRSSTGEALDAISSDMESNLSPGTVAALGQSLRDALGPSYPLVAIVYSPLSHASDAAHVPWSVLPRYFDIIAPMTYWSGKGQKIDAYTYTAQTIKQVRQLVGKSDVEIHPIGDGMYSTIYQLRLFMKACKDNEATGASLYPNQKLTASQLDCLTEYGTYFQPNSRFRLAAYRQLRSSGALPEPPQGDPSRYISRGKLYQLIVSGARTQTQPMPTQEEAYRFLAEHGIAAPISDPAACTNYLSSLISIAEAQNVVAALNESQKAQLAGTHIAKHKGSWLIQSAKASEPHTVPTGDAQERTVNYIDAAQLVLQSRARLH